jgi:hypothetical protein
MDIKRHLTQLVINEKNEPSESFDKLYNYIWQNPRKKSSGGLRLTEEGYQLLVNELDLKSYSIDFCKETTITNQVMIWLDKFIDSPYYIDKNSIVVFKEKMAVQLILFNGDIQKYGIARAMAEQEK